MKARRFSVCAAAALSVLLLGGCAASTWRITPAPPGRLSKSGKHVAFSIEGMNSGVYLFYYIPLWSGSPTNPNENRIGVFRHRVNDKAIFRMFDEANSRMHTSGVEDIVTDHRSVGVWTLWIFWKRSVHGRALLVSKKPITTKKRFK